jgi:hypothetical protein
MWQTFTSTSVGISTTATIVTVIPSATLVPNNITNANDRSFKNNPGAIAGTVIGILLLLMAIVVWAVFSRRRANTRRMEQNALTFGPEDDVFRPPLNESDDDLTGPAMMSERMRGGRLSTLSASGLAVMTPGTSGATMAGYDSLARAKAGAGGETAVEDDGLMANEEGDEEVEEEEDDGMYTASLNHPEVASSLGHYVTAPTTPGDVLATAGGPLNALGAGAGAGGVSAAAGVVGAGAGAAAMAGARSSRGSAPPSPTVPRSRKSSGIEPGMWYAGKAAVVPLEAPPSPVVSSGHGHLSSAGHQGSSSAGHAQSSSSGPRTSTDISHGVWRPIGYGTSGSPIGHEFGMIQPAPRRPIMDHSASNSGSGSGSSNRRSMSPSVANAAGSGSSSGHGGPRTGYAAASGSSLGHGLNQPAPAVMAAHAYGSGSSSGHGVVRTPSPQIGGASGSSHGHGTSSHGHGAPTSSHGHGHGILAPSSHGHGSSSDEHGYRSSQGTRVGFVDTEPPPSSFRKHAKGSPVSTRIGHSSSPVDRQTPLSRQSSQKSTKSFIAKSLRGRFSRKKSDLTGSAPQSLPGSSMDVAEHFASASASAAAAGRSASPKTRRPVPTFFQSPHAAAHEHRRLSQYGAASPIIALPPGAQAPDVLCRPTSLGELPRWDYQPTLAALAQHEANTPSNNSRWAWPGLSPGLTLPPLPSPDVQESVYSPDGLLHPELGSRLGHGQVANQSTAAISLGDHEDYSRPIGAVSLSRKCSPIIVETDVRVVACYASHEQLGHCPDTVLPADCRNGWCLSILHTGCV